ncbi:hypothetical protein BDBG_03328 [Blastomyces gilchristii SLH14081]|uniref:Uncharacterized protein n=1 Tax=Blastomyces gilchristii (strain SLH14081) TaxID=559298 RepID=A0A179UJP0_BLAGS|nr:uncharacterized protein BDBG_03328 [Blastomyces gilchristii SLH14081]OAT07241.1 hypothetical protein BDBG_03328 [Blastomyces gilchristii SLH14081]
METDQEVGFLRFADVWVPDRNQYILPVPEISSSSMLLLLPRRTLYGFRRSVDPTLLTVERLKIAFQTSTTKSKPLSGVARLASALPLAIMPTIGSGAGRRLGQESYAA